MKKLLKFEISYDETKEANVVMVDINNADFSSEDLETIHLVLQDFSKMVCLAYLSHINEWSSEEQIERKGEA